MSNYTCPYCGQGFEELDQYVPHALVCRNED